jgi:hypothetical protein
MLDESERDPELAPWPSPTRGSSRFPAPDSWCSSSSPMWGQGGHRLHRAGRRGRAGGWGLDDRRLRGRGDTPLAAFGPLTGPGCGCRPTGRPGSSTGICWWRATHISARLLASDADIDPECCYALGRLARVGATDRRMRGADPKVRLSSRGRVRARRGLFMEVVLAVMLLALGAALTGVAMLGVPPRWPGLQFLAVGVALVLIVLGVRHIDKRRYRALQRL